MNGPPAMSSGRDEGPVYYREIQKNAYLKRIPNDMGASKLRPLGHKKVPLKPMWTLLCVHNGRRPFLEQYADAQCAGAQAHKPLWRACLLAARHVTASVKPHQGDEYDFLIDTDQGPVRMLAPDWESMNDWVTTLRNKLHELKILSKGENVYCAPPAPPAPRAAARDPTSPLPPTPPVPPDRVPGIDLTTVRPNPEPQEPETQTPEPENIDISSWDTYTPQPSTSNKIPSTNSVTKICGQNICLDDSILKRNVVTDSDEEFGDDEEFKQRLVVDGEAVESDSGQSSQSDRQATNITVIQVSNRPPHTAIPVMGPETNVFDFNFKQKLTLNSESQNSNSNSFINIVNTESVSENGYGTVFEEGDYGHLSLTTTVNLTGDVNSTGNVNLTDVKMDNEGIYERLCMASTSQNSRASPLPVRKIKNLEISRKSSLPNLDTAEATYEYLFPNSQNNNRNTTVTLNSSENSIQNGRAEINSNDSRLNSDVSINTSDTSRNTTDISRNTADTSRNTNDISRNTSDISRNTTDISRNTADISRNTSLNNDIPRNERTESQNRPIVHVNLTNSISVGNVDLNATALRSNVERSHSQNAYDTSPRMREQLIRRVQNNSPKREAKNDKSEPQPKPIWKRGLTELSLLSRLRGVGHRRQESPTRRESEMHDRGVTSAVKVVHRSRPEGRIDGTRRRSSSLTNGQSPPSLPNLQPLRARQAASLRAEQRRGAAVAASLSTRDNIVFCDYNRQVWIVSVGAAGARSGARAGDRLVALRGATPRDSSHARQLLKSYGHCVDILFHRVPLGKIYVLNKRDLESIGIKLDGECNITSVEPSGAAARAGIPPPGKWAVTEVNNRPLNLVKGGDEEMNRLSLHGSEVSVLIQPSALVKKMRAALKGNKPLLSIR